MYLQWFELLCEILNHGLAQRKCMSLPWDLEPIGSIGGDVAMPSCAYIIRPFTFPAAMVRSLMKVILTIKLVGVCAERTSVS